VAEAAAPRPAAWGVLSGGMLDDCADAGLINQTWLVGSPPRYVVQRVNPLFRPEVHEDIEAVTAHLARLGLPTPRLVRTDTGALCAVAEDGAAWRVMDFVPGVTVHRMDGPARAHAAGALVARFHGAVDDLDWSYRHVRPGAHDTARHMAELERVVREGPALPVAEGILEGWRRWPGRLDTPTRHAHGDLKISNLRFDTEGNGLCLLDLDTLSRLSLDVELGDAWRSWCNPVGEDSVEARLDLGLLAAAIAGYRSARALSADEVDALGVAVERIALELAARFCKDAVEDRYFGWDARRFPSRVAHNLFRAQGQLALARSAAASRAEIAGLLRRG
jgi:Ser/Thr protein kinase RdoA (MazF antagonist)